VWKYRVPTHPVLIILVINEMQGFVAGFEGLGPVFLACDGEKGCAYGSEHTVRDHRSNAKFVGQGLKA
jgi:hypothetical protein